MFEFFERCIQPTVVSGNPPPSGLLAFYWHFVSQTKGLYAALFATGLIIILIDILIPVFIGRLVALMETTERTAALRDAIPMLAGMAFLVLIARPVAIFIDSLVRYNALVPGVTSMIRWQSHWHVARQNWPFFQKDFAGRIASRVMGTSHAVRESVMKSIHAVWYIAVYGVSALLLMSDADWRLALPTALWFLSYVLFLWHFVPRLRDLANASSVLNSAAMGRIVDSYSNILTVKLFSRTIDEDAYVREVIDDHTAALSSHMRSITKFMSFLAILNALLLASTAAIGLLLWGHGDVDASTVAMAIPLAWTVANSAGWVSWDMASVFENVGVVQEGMETIASPHRLIDKPNALRLGIDTGVVRGEIRFENVSFNYAPDDSKKILDSLSFTIHPGERVGVVGRSGAGKSTLLINLLLRFYDLETGSIRIDGYDIRELTQESLRGAIGVVTQDTSLLHRSIAENIAYGRSGADAAQIESAARQAQAHEFILSQKDWKGRTGYEAHVGERGIKLSGGQRQRIAIARMILKDAPILVLDEATSALDSEAEFAIQEQLLGLMKGKTVIAIAHRLSTIVCMDRLLVLDSGHIVEQGTHEELLKLGRQYATLWRHQSGGFL